MKLPIRGFSNANFRRAFDVINLDLISELYNDGEVVSLDTLRERGYIKGTSYGIKILGSGELTKKVTIEAQAISDGARKKLQQANVECLIN